MFVVFLLFKCTNALLYSPIGQTAFVRPPDNEVYRSALICPNDAYYVGQRQFPSSPLLVLNTFDIEKLFDVINIKVFTFMANAKSSVRFQFQESLYHFGHILCHRIIGPLGALFAIAFYFNENNLILLYPRILF